ncbi:MAG: HD domain-containing protein [Thermodesulfovibrionales bacterium]|nr:HD domain-containing protein [Thermodesulfovibrionales bacterium]
MNFELKPMMDIAKLQAEVARLNAELQKAREQLRDHEESRKAMLYMLEDLNKAKTHIEQAKKEWEATFDAITDPVFIHDSDFRIVRANKAYQEAAGMPFEEIIGKPYYEVFPKMEAPFNGCLKALRLQEEVLTPAGRIYKIRFYPVKGMDNKYSVHILEDITEIKRAEEKIKQEGEITAHLLMIAETTRHTIDIDKLMEQVMFCGREIVRCDVCLSYLWDNETKVFAPCRACGLEHGLMPIFMTEPLDEKTGFVREAFGRKEPVIIIDYRLMSLRGSETTEAISQDKEDKEIATHPSGARNDITSRGAFPWLPNISAIAVIPFIGKKGYLGLLAGIYLDREPLFTERDKKIMKGIMHQVSAALDQAKLYKDSIDRAMELSHKIETIKVMHEIDRNILSTLNPDELIETAVRMVSKVIACDRATVAIVDKEKQGFTWKAGVGTTFLPKIGFAAFKDTSAAEVIKTGMPEYCANLMDVKEPLLVEAGLIKEGFLSHIRVPLTAKGEIVGILTVGSKRVSAFTPEDLATLEKIASQIGVALENSRLLKDREDLFFGVIKTLSSAIDAKSPWTAGHSERVTEYAVEIGKKIGLSQKELKDLELTGLLHDIGKIGTYEYILDKPDKLTDEELKIMRQHPENGAKILFSINQFKDIIPGIRHHHEFYDGAGYPDGLKGEEIPPFARILTIADTFDAMKAERPYRKGRTMDEIILEFKRCSGTQFDPKMAEVFLKMLEKEKFQ